MKLVEPKVYKIAETKMNMEGVTNWLTDMGAEEALTTLYGSDSEKLTAVCAKRCYKSFTVGLNPNVSKIRTDTEEYLKNVLKSGHGSVLEHATVSFAFENVSRVFTHELVRHRAGSAMSQESLRYVRLTDLNFFAPMIFKNYGDDKYEKVMEVVNKTVTNLEGVQKELAEIFDIDNMKDFGAKKKLTSAFRRLAPIGLATGIIFTANLRAWRHILAMRTSRHAEEEIRIAMAQVGTILKNDHPILFGDFKEEEVDGLGEFTPEYPKV